MKCPVCGSIATRVIRSEPVERGVTSLVRRRRSCTPCRHRWSTWEVEATGLVAAMEILIENRLRERLEKEENDE